jgi:hydroxymethylpyrimidine/phosphomethylpyrimidine kinase
VTTCLTIAGFDPTGNAGVLADFETFKALAIDPTAVITAITAQNNKRVSEVEALSPRLIAAQFNALKKPAAIKIGMLANAAIIYQVAKLIPRKVPVVLDPVLRASSGRALLEPKAIPVLIKTLLPLCTVITPNRAEASKLLGRKIRDLESAASDLLNLGPKSVIITGGAKADVLADSRGVKIIEGKRARGTSRGTGCRYSSALAAYLAKGRIVRQAARQAQQYVWRYVASRERGSGVLI